MSPTRMARLPRCDESPNEQCCADMIVSGSRCLCWGSPGALVPTKEAAPAATQFSRVRFIAMRRKQVRDKPDVQKQHAAGFCADFGAVTCAKKRRRSRAQS